MEKTIFKRQRQPTQKSEEKTICETRSAHKNHTFPPPQKTNPIACATICIKGEQISETIKTETIPNQSRRTPKTKNDLLYSAPDEDTPTPSTKTIAPLFFPNLSPHSVLIPRWNINCFGTLPGCNLFF